MPNITHADEQIAQAEAAALAELDQASGEAEKVEETTTKDQAKPVAEEAKGDTATPSPEETQEGSSEDTKAEDVNATAAESVDLSQFKAKGQERVKKLADEASQVPELKKEIARLQRVLGLSSEPKVADSDQGRSSNQPTTSLPTPQPTPVVKLPWDMSPDVDSDSEETMSPEELQQKIDQGTQKGIQNQRMLDTIDYDIATAEDKYPELREPTEDNPNPEFNKDLADLISKSYNSLFEKALNEKKTPPRVITYIDSIMSLKSKGAEEERLKTQQIVEKQDAEQAIDSAGTVSASDDGNVETQIKSARTSKDLEEAEKLLPHAE